MLDFFDGIIDIFKSVGDKFIDVVDSVTDVISDLTSYPSILKESVAFLPSNVISVFLALFIVSGFVALLLALLRRV